MPFKSKAQQAAAWGGHLGPEMKRKAKTWSAMTDQSKLPEHVRKKKAMPSYR